MGGAGRRASIQHMRMRSAGERLSRVKWLSKVCWKASKVGRGNPFAVALWGVEVLGGAPYTMKNFRAQAAAATGMLQAQRCATMAIHIGYGMDPVVEVIRRQLVSFFRYIRQTALACAPLAAKYRVAWRAARERILLDGQVRWR